MDKNLSKEEKRKQKKREKNKKRRQKKKEKEEQLKKKALEKGIDENEIAKHDNQEFHKFKFSLPLPTKENYKEVSSKRFEGLLKQNDSNDWEEISKFEKKGIRAFKKVDEASSIFYIKSVGEINCEIKKLFGKFFIMLISLLNFCKNNRMGL